MSASEPLNDSVVERLVRDSIRLNGVGDRPCCGDSSWRGCWCEYHRGMHDGLNLAREFLRGVGSEPLFSSDDEFAVPIETGMRPAEHGIEFDRGTTDELRRRLDEFDACRNRGAVEARTTYIAKGRHA